MKLPAEQYDTLLERLAALSSIPAYDPRTMVTVQDFAKRLDTTEGIARKQLDRLERDGVLRKFTVRRPDGYRVVAYAEKEA